MNRFKQEGKGNSNGKVDFEFSRYHDSFDITPYSGNLDYGCVVRGIGFIKVMDNVLLCMKLVNFAKLFNLFVQYAKKGWEHMKEHNRFMKLTLTAWIKQQSMKNGTCSKGCD